MDSFEIKLHFLTIQGSTNCVRLKQWIQAYFESTSQGICFPDKAVQLHWVINEAQDKATRPIRHYLQSTPEVVTRLDVPMVTLPVWDGLCQGQLMATYNPQASDPVPQAPEDWFELSYDLNLNQVHLTVSGVFAHHREWFIFYLVLPLIKRYLFPLHQLVPLHGAVVADEMNTYFLAGVSGSGKSTLALQLASEGFTLLSDDTPLMTKHQGKGWVLPSLDCCRVFPDSLALFPHLSDYVIPYHADKWGIQRHVFGSQNNRHEAKQVTDVMLLNRCSEGPLGIEPLSKSIMLHQLLSDTVKGFWTSTLSNAHPRLSTYNQTMFESHWALLAQAQCWVLHYSNEDLTRVGQYLRQRAWSGLGNTTLQGAIER